LKPLADTRSEVIVLGHPDPALTALPWTKRKAALWEVVRRELRELRKDADLVLIEGAGSPAEINLPDIVNMRVAEEANAPVLLVSDIDRGGAFASLYGTWALLPESRRARIRGFVLNKFRGDAALLAPAPECLSELTGVPTLGVIPWIRLDLPDEDGASLSDRGNRSGLRIVAIRLPHISNFDDLDPLAAEDGVNVSWVDRPGAVGEPAAIVVPGTRNTTGDLRWLWEGGLAAAIRARADRGVPVVGICGGYQMLGERVADPLGLEGGGEVEGIGLLSLRTELGADKTTRLALGRWSAASGPLRELRGREAAGYEIHHGRTELRPGAEEILDIAGVPAGAMCGGVWGCYLHGLFANDDLRTTWLRSLRDVRVEARSWEAHLDAELDRLADVVEDALDMAVIDSLIESGG
jgi:adenosylcobyric acid synthase